MSDHPFPPPEVPPHRVDEVYAAFDAFTRESVLLEVRDGKVRWREKPGFEDRNACVVALAERAAATRRLPDATLCVFTGDALRRGEPSAPWIAAFARREGERRVLFPNFNFVHHRAKGIGDWDTVRQDLDRVGRDRPWPDRDPRLFFAGAATNPMRARLARAVCDDPRFRVEIGGPHRSLTEHADHQWLLNLNGWGYSGRLHYLLATGAGVVQLRDRRPAHRWHEFWTGLLVPGQHLLVVDYRRWEPMYLVVRRLLRATAQADGAKVGATGRDLVADALRPDHIDTYVAVLLTAVAAAVGSSSDR